MPVQGDFRKLNQWAKLLRGGRVLVEADSKAIAELMVSLIQDGFGKETNPYGEPWQPKKAVDGRKTLSGPTGRLKTGWHTKVLNKKIMAAPSVAYAAYHQGGTVKMVQRMMVPNKHRGLPEAWVREFAEIANDTAKRYFENDGRLPAVNANHGGGAAGGGGRVRRKRSAASKRRLGKSVAGAFLRRLANKALRTALK